MARAERNGNGPRPTVRGGSAPLACRSAAETGAVFWHVHDALEGGTTSHGGLEFSGARAQARFWANPHNRRPGAILRKGPWVKPGKDLRALVNAARTALTPSAAASRAHVRVSRRACRAQETRKRESRQGWGPSGRLVSCDC